MLIYFAFYTFYFIAIIACINAYTSSAFDLSLPNFKVNVGFSIDLTPILTIYEAI